MSNFQEKSTFIWNIADLLRGSYKRNEYQKVILPFTILKRFDSVLKHSKKEVVKFYEEHKDSFSIDEMRVPMQDFLYDEEENPLNFYNVSSYTFDSLLDDPEQIEENLNLYIDSFTSNVIDILENFKIKDQISRLAEADLLYLLMNKFTEDNIDLSPKKVSNHEMGTIFEELIRKFSETSNEEAGEHFTPRDIIKLMTEIMFINDENLNEEGIIRTVYDPACGTGGMLTSCEEYIKKQNSNTNIVLYGQEINPEIYAICKADMLIKGENEGNIKGPKSTLSNDLLPNNKYDYIISNPPYGRDWEIDYDKVTKENEEQGYNGRFGAGTPRKNDGQLLFIQHMISKMKENEKSRIAVITNGSPLFTGDAGSGESNIRKWIIENDYLETLIALPGELFFNTGIKTYIWILTNEKTSERQGKIQLIDATEEYTKIRKSLGNKRNTITEEHITKIKEYYNTIENTDKIKIFDNTDFGYTKVVVERPLQRNYQINNERLDNLYSIPAFKKLAESKNKNPEEQQKEEKKGKQKQQEIIESLKTIGTDKYTNWDQFEAKIKQALKKYDFIKPATIKQIILKLSEYDETATIVTDKKGNPKPDTELRDTEKIPLQKDIDEYFIEEVTPYYPQAWMDRKKDKTGYKINFTQYFYTYTPPRPLEEIEKDIEQITQEIRQLIGDI
ncbi:type I restriction-modification system subunit M [Methanosphaera stadtmanae]|uniref:type I restriction-modification system subunit M n=1 Tax=Methanosphaera stadtmanae TaxID=2317 RepID=UPI00267724D0|nr:class I SAM-dependent DNA methyltransferase [Methanosphaera stadtmanae]